VLSKREICWNIKARQSGYHQLMLQVESQRIAKELAVGDGFMRVSTKRPGWDWSEALLHPREPPFGPDSPVESIEIDYPERASWIYGTHGWLRYWFIVSFVAALCFSRVLNVNV
jgi:hypothetical protein